MMTGIGMGFGLWGFFVMFLFFGGLIALAAWLIKAIVGTPTRSTPDAPISAREVLDLRYARGEVDQEQYEQVKKELSNTLS